MNKKDKNTTKLLNNLTKIQIKMEKYKNKNQLKTVNNKNYNSISMIHANINKEIKTTLSML